MLLDNNHAPWVYNTLSRNTDPDLKATPWPMNPCSLHGRKKCIRMLGENELHRSRWIMLCTWESTGWRLTRSAAWGQAHAPGIRWVSPARCASGDASDGPSWSSTTRTPARPARRGTTSDARSGRFGFHARKKEGELDGSNWGCFRRLLSAIERNGDWTQRRPPIGRRCGRSYGGKASQQWRPCALGA
jgi:hypothetical protein